MVVGEACPLDLDHPSGIATHITLDRITNVAAHIAVDSRNFPATKGKLGLNAIALVSRCVIAAGKLGGIFRHGEPPGDRDRPCNAYNEKAYTWGNPVYGAPSESTEPLNFGDRWGLILVLIAPKIFLKQ